MDTDRDVRGAHGAAGPRGEFAAEVMGRPIWRLLLRGIGVFLPGWEMPSGALRVRAGAAPAGFGPPAYLDGDAGFGVQLPDRRKGLEPDREIYVRGRENPSFGIVIAGPAAAIGTRIVDAGALLRFARRLTFQELLDPGDPESVPSAVRGARAVENAVFLDRAAGIGLCAEADPATRTAACPLYVRIGVPAEQPGTAREDDPARPPRAAENGPPERGIRVYAAAQPVRSQG